MPVLFSACESQKGGEIRIQLPPEYWSILWVRSKLRHDALGGAQKFKSNRFGANRQLLQEGGKLMRFNVEAGGLGRRCLTIRRARIVDGAVRV